MFVGRCWVRQWTLCGVVIGCVRHDRWMDGFACAGPLLNVRRGSAWLRDCNSENGLGIRSLLSTHVDKQPTSPLPRLGKAIFVGPSQRTLIFSKLVRTRWLDSKGAELKTSCYIFHVIQISKAVSLQRNLANGAIM